MIICSILYTTFGWVWLVMHLSNHIVVFFDHKYTGKESIYVIPGDNHQEEVAPEGANFGWVWPGVPFV